MPLSQSARSLLSGAIIGFVLGYAMSAALPPRPGSGGEEAERLRHQLEAVRRERDGLQRNLTDFQEVAERMTRAFEDLEARFRSLEGRLQGGGETAPAGQVEEPAS